MKKIIEGIIRKDSAKDIEKLNSNNAYVILETVHCHFWERNTSESENIKGYCPIKITIEIKD